MDHNNALSVRLRKDTESLAKLLCERRHEQSICTSKCEWCRPVATTETDFNIFVARIRFNLRVHVAEIGDGMMMINVRLKGAVRQTDLGSNLLHDLPNFGSIAARTASHAILVGLVKRAGRKRNDDRQEEQGAHET